MTEEIIQGSPEWLQLRLGRVTASRVADVVAKTKSGYSTSRANYAAQLIAERLTGVVAPSFTNAAMEHGTATEPEARSAYEFYKGVTVEQVAFVSHPTIDQAGCSPDGLIGNDGMLEIKCPQTAAHLETLLGQAVPGKYETQMQFQMSCTGRAWCDFVSYDPRMPENMRLFFKRVHRDQKRIEELETEVSTFLLEIVAKVDELNSLYGLGKAA